VTLNKAERERVTKENLTLARKIFNIMEGNSDIAEKISDTRHIDNHPGTMNFRIRLAEAQRIHERNMLLASRLDTVKPFYGPAELLIGASRPIRKKQQRPNTKKIKFAKDLVMAMKVPFLEPTARVPKLFNKRVHLKGSLTQRSANDASSEADKDSYQGTPSGSQSARTSADTTAAPTTTSSSRPNNVLLEYTKIQEGRILDIAVLKEPFRDSYAIFGIDVDDGQRYQLRLNSDDVSSILDGDILVTSVDNVEVWMALLNKVTLHKVNAFAKLPIGNDDAERSDKAISSDVSVSRSKNQSESSPRLQLHGPSMDASSFDEAPAASSSNSDEIPAKLRVRTPVPPAGVRRSSQRHSGHRGSIAEHPPPSAETPLTPETERQQHQQDGGAFDLDERVAALTIRNQNIIADNNMDTPAGGSLSFDDGTHEKDTTISDIFALHELSTIVDRSADEE
jgi:hypothetical protein